MERDGNSDNQIRQILSYRNVAVIGMSKNPEKAAHYVPKYLLKNGYNIIPVNPTADQILGKKCHSHIDRVKSDIDTVEIFRPSSGVMEVIDGAIRKRPGTIWLQEGIHNEKAEELAAGAGIRVVFNRCMLAEHRRLF